ncbi:hypothetical protein [Virgibacillus sp. DJP39]|uniref:hypothetical protein n=1 Tax=Virgibacillus sp. DJP39 TaxID=3409790 RepID=UPI003BB5E38D
MIVAKRIKKLRTTLNIPRREFCKGIVSLSHLSNIESGRFVPSEDILISFANKAGMPKDYLVNPHKDQEKVATKIKELHVLLDDDLSECVTEIEIFERSNPYIASYLLEIEFYLLKANSCIKSGKMELAYQVYSQNVEPLIDDSLLEHKNLRYLLKKFKGVFSYHRSNYGQAITDYKIFLKEDLDTLEQAKVNFNIALCYDKKSDNYHAIRYIYKALDKYTQELDWDGVGKSYNFLGSLFEQIKNYCDAEIYYKKALKLSNEMELISLKCKVLHNLGELSKNRNDYEQAILLFNQAIKIKKNYNHTNLSITYCSLIDSFILMNRFQEAKLYLYEALKHTNSQLSKVRLNTLKEKMAYKNEQGSSYEPSLKGAMDYFEFNNPLLYSKYVKELGNYYMEQRKYKLAANCFKKLL